MYRIYIINEIESKILDLSPSEQSLLLERIARNLGKKKRAKVRELDWDKLYGLGKDLWGGEDAQDYINRLRKERL